MATRPSLNIAVQGTKNTATKYNENFELMMDFIDDSLAESKTYVDTYMPSVTGQNGRFLTNDGENISWADIEPDIIQLASSGTINLITNTVNCITPTGAVTFVLPSVNASINFNQILVQVNLTTVKSINVGTTHFFNGKTPNLSTVGKYNLMFEYDKNNDFWVCGWMRKS